MGRESDEETRRGAGPRGRDRGTRGIDLDASRAAAGVGILIAAASIWVAGEASGQTKPSGSGASTTASAAASQAPAASSSATAQAPVSPQRAVPAVTKVADGLAQALGKLPARSLITAGALVSEPAAPKGNALALAVAGLLAGRIGNAARSHADVAALASARTAARTGDAPALVFVSVEIAAGKLRATADVYPVPRTVWATIRDPEPAPIAHAFAEAPIDAEVRSYLPAIPLVTAQTDRGRNFESDVVAIACGDLDRDGSSEIATVGRRRVTTSRIRAGKVEPLRGRLWTEIAPVNPAPLREPYAFATIVERGSGEGAKATLDVGLTDRALSVRFDRGLEVDATFPGLAVPDGGGTACTKIAALVVTGPLVPCKKGDPAPLAASVGGQYDAFASAALVTAGGAPYVVWAGREKGVVELRDDAGHTARIDGMGAQLAVGDLDQDGDPEIVGSVDTLNALDDAVLVKTWRRASGKVEDRLKIPAAAGVRALGVCPPDGPGHTPFVVATLDEIWVVR